MASIPRKSVFMLFVALGLMAAGCQRHQAPQPTVGDLDAMGLPESAQLVAFTKLPSAPLLFIAGQDGRVCYAANRQVVASFQVEEGHQVYLHGGYSDGRTATKLSLQGSTIYETSTRAAENRLYFIPDLR